jgi:hypothetical protein
MNNSSPVRTALTKKALAIEKEATEQKKRPKKIEVDKGDHI